MLAHHHSRAALRIAWARWPTTRRLCAAIVAALTMALAPAAGALAAGVPNEECLDCHEDADDTITFDDGSTREVGIEREAWEASVHGSELRCTDCHTSIVEYPHPSTQLGTPRTFRAAQGATCKRCHYAYYTHMLDSIHYQQHSAGDTAAPTCVDCHGSHTIRSLRDQHVVIDQRCGQCHGDIAEVYAQSVHGMALLATSADGEATPNLDVPVCTDCHGAHAIADPTAPAFHARSHEICARCHADAERMEPYGLNPNVLDTYLTDFHGVSNQLYAAGAGTPDKPMATCSDCHGVHDIQPFDKEDGAAGVRDRVVAVCQRCHTDATPAFADAWLSHYEPTFSSAPLVWGVTWVYRILIPMIMLGLVLHILLHLWRLRAHR